MSPVYERTYEHFEGKRTPIAQRFWVVTQHGLQQAFATKWVWLLLAGTLVHVTVRGGILSFAGQPGTGLSGGDPDYNFTARYLGHVLEMQARLVLLLVLALVASPALAADRRAGALQFYFSKPVTRRAYAFGKLLPPFVLGWLLTGGVGLVVWVLGVAFTPRAFYPDHVWRLPFALILAGAAMSAVATLVAVGLSGVMQNSRLAAAMWVALGVVSTALSHFLMDVTSRDDVGVVGFFGVLERIARWALAADGSTLPLGPALLVALVWAAVGAALIWFVLRDPEVAA